MSHRSANGKRVCDISSDRKMIEIEIKGCVTQITVGIDGTFKIESFMRAA